MLRRRRRTRPWNIIHCLRNIDGREYGWAPYLGVAWITVLKYTKWQTTSHITSYKSMSRPIIYYSTTFTRQHRHTPSLLLFFLWLLLACSLLLLWMIMSPRCRRDCRGKRCEHGRVVVVVGRSFCRKWRCWWMVCDSSGGQRMLKTFRFVIRIVFNKYH